MARNSIEITEEQARWFRTRRGFLAGTGAPDAVVAARAVLGIQAQQEGPAMLGLSQRMAGRPAAAALAARITTEPRSLVHTWGQRDTLHFFDAADWFSVVAARPLWVGGSRRGGMPPEALLKRCRYAVSEIEGPFTKAAVYDLLPAEYLDAVVPFAERARMEPLRFAATRVLWRLAQCGDVFLAGKTGAERFYMSRTQAYPDLTWSETTDPIGGAARFARRYLSTYGPATAADIGHFFGARVGDVRHWLERLECDLVDVSCGGRRGLLALIGDVDDLCAKPPDDETWSVRLLPLWDGLLMGHKDKSWFLPEKENKRIWRPGAYVAATVLARGRIVATWSHRAGKRVVNFELRPLSGWRKDYLKPFEREMEAVAVHLGLERGALRQK